MRISKGYSQMELSFLLGLPGNRVATIEGFIQNKEYSILTFHCWRSYLNVR